MSRMKKLGVVLESTQPDQREHMEGRQERKRHPSCTLAVIWLFGGM